MKKLIVILLMFPIVCFAQDDAIRRLFTKMEKQALQSDFTVTITEQATQPTNLTGKIVMRGECFTAEIMGTELAYDGKTLYSYSEDINELTLSYPTMEELIESNPLLFAKDLVNSNETEVREQGANYLATIHPDEASTGVKEFSLLMRKSDLMPLSATMKETGMRTTTLTFRNTVFLQSAPEFTISKPEAYVNDLR